MNNEWDDTKDTATGRPCLTNLPPDFHEQPLGL